jgi:hypothetical protein
MHIQEIYSSAPTSRRQRLGKALPLWVLMIAILTIGHATWAQELPDPPAGMHGMLVLGTKEKIYLQHLAMRTHAAHRFQLIIEVEFVRGPQSAIEDRAFVGQEMNFETASATQIYFHDRNHKNNHTPLYTFVPAQQFALTEIPQGKRVSIQGRVVRGHFERDAGAPVVLRDIEVKINHILCFQDLRQPIAGTPHPLQVGKLGFLLFGANGEYFMSHQVTLHGRQGAPDDNGFHQEFPIKASTAGLLNFDVARSAVSLEIDAVHATSEGRLPQQGGTFAARLNGLIQGMDTPLALQIELDPEHYLEVLM